MPHDVFICHSHTDLDIALAACAKLEKANVRCWIAPRNVGAGAYAHQLVHAISEATAVVLVFSEKSNSSEHVLRELEIAASRHKVIIPFRIEDVAPNEDLEYFTLRMHWLDALAPPMETRLGELVTFVQQLLAPSAAPEARTHVVSSPPALHNLPSLLTTFYGRAHDLETLTEQLRDHRLVTLVGFGGIGKTRMAIEAGWHLLEQFADGVFLVELAPLADPALVSTRVAAALGVPAQAGQLSGDLWLDGLREKHALLVLDNCEHVLDAAGEIAHRLLQRCPHFRILATSREPLHVPSERVVRIAPLAVPAPAPDDETLDSIRAAPSVLLFLDRISDVAPDFTIADHDVESWTALGDICTRLDGIPLALELAAARVPALGLIRLARGLDHRFKLLTHGAHTSLPRQQTLEATLDWSYATLAEGEPGVFDRLGVFAGAFTAEAAAAVCSSDELDETDVLDILASLVDKSLVVADRSGPTVRYRLLETTRAYARKELTEKAELRAVQRRHAEHYHALSVQARETFGTISFEEWIGRFEPEIDNFRNALAWTIEERGDPLLGATILCNLKRVFEWVSLNAEVLSWCDRALTALGTDAPPAIEAELAIVATRHHMALAAFHAAIPTAQRAVTLLRQLDEKLSLAFGLTLLGRVLASRPEEREAADRLIDEALEIYEAVRTGAADTRNDEGELVRLLTNALAASYKAMTIDPRELDRRREILTESFARFSLLSPGYFIIGVILENLSEVELEAGNYELALARALESVEFYRHSSSGFGSLFALNGAGTATLASGDVDASRGHALELLWRVRRIGSAPGLAMALLLLAAIEASTRDGVLAAGLLGAWETSAGRIDTPPATTNYLCSRTREALARSLDDEALEAAVAAGRRWSVEDAINVALMVAENR